MPRFEKFDDWTILLNLALLPLGHCQDLPFIVASLVIVAMTPELIGDVVESAISCDRSP
jgi:hypothetical protein